MRKIRGGKEQEKRWKLDKAADWVPLPSSNGLFPKGQETTRCSQKIPQPLPSQQRGVDGKKAGSKQVPGIREATSTQKVLEESTPNHMFNWALWDRQAPGSSDSRTVVPVLWPPACPFRGC